MIEYIDEKEIVVAFLKASTIKHNLMDRIKAKIVNAITPRQLFIGTREDFQVFQDKYVKKDNE